MVTHLVGLRFAVNVEDQLDHLQRRLLAENGDTGARFLPPLIPVGWYSDPPPVHILDQIRRTVPVRIRDMRASDADRPGAPPDRISIPPDSVPATDLDSLAGALTERWSDSWTPAGPPWGIVLSWRDRTAGPPPLSLPNTDALWLSLFRLEIPGRGSEDRWWEYGRWDEQVTRRVRSRRRR